MDKNADSIKNIFFYLCMILITSCNNHHNREGVELAMNQYDHLIKNMDADSIALLYTPDGDIGDVVHGRDSIRKFLLSFKNVSVVSQSSITKSIEINGDSSLQKGTYLQIVYVTGKDTIKLKVNIPQTGYGCRPANGISGE
jgi:hypothetical protein